MLNILLNNLLENAITQIKFQAQSKLNCWEQARFQVQIPRKLELWEILCRVRRDY